MNHLAVLFFLMWTGPVPGAATVFEIIIVVAPQQTAMLPCRAARDKPIIALDWSRPDMKSEFVLLFRDNHIDTELQHPSFKNRVDLLDRQMKNGDASLVLKNVTFGDSGTYECRVFQKGLRRRKRSVLVFEPIIVIKLRVVRPGQIHEDKKDKVINEMENQTPGLEDFQIQENLSVLVPLVAVVVLLMTVARCSARCCHRPLSK